MNIYYLRYLSDSPPMMHWTTPLAPGEEYQLRDNNHQLSQGFRVEYESLGGKKYQQFADWMDGKMKMEFRAPD
jgi:hypothetical protein